MMLTHWFESLNFLANVAEKIVYWINEVYSIENSPNITIIDC